MMAHILGVPLDEGLTALPALAAAVTLLGARIGVWLRNERPVRRRRTDRARRLSD